MTVLVTGGAGYIGSHMVHALVEAGEQVVVIDNLSTGFQRAFPHGVPLVRRRCRRRDAVSNVDRRSTASRASSISPARVVVPDSMRDPLGYYRNNTVTTRALLNAAVKSGVKRFIFSSTAAVYGNPDQVPVPEDAPTRPLSPYGSSKLMTEIMLHDVALGARHELRRAALFQRRGRRSARAASGSRPSAPRICSRSRSRPRPASAPRSTCSAPTIRRPTAAASAISSMSAISPRRIARRCHICAAAASR